MSASAAVPILYNVDRVRDGRSYVTRAVRAVQRGRTIFIMLCSFQRPEPRQCTFQLPMPPNVPLPDACEGIEVIYERLFKETSDSKVKDFCLTALEVQKLVHDLATPLTRKRAPSGTSAQPHRGQVGWRQGVRGRLADILVLAQSAKHACALRSCVPEGMS